MDNPLVQVEPGLFIWTIFTFLVLLGIFVVSLLVLHRGISRLELSRVTRLGED